MIPQNFKQHVREMEHNSLNELTHEFQGGANVCQAIRNLVAELDQKEDWMQQAQEFIYLVMMKIDVWDWDKLPCGGRGLVESYDLIMKEKP